MGMNFQSSLKVFTQHRFQGLAGGDGIVVNSMFQASVPVLTQELLYPFPVYFLQTPGSGQQGAGFPFQGVELDRT